MKLNFLGPGYDWPIERLAKENSLLYCRKFELLPFLWICGASIVSFGVFLSGIGSSFSGSGSGSIKISDSIILLTSGSPLSKLSPYY